MSLFGHMVCMQLNVVVGKVEILPQAMRSQVQFSAQRPAILTAFHGCPQSSTRIPHITLKC